jgi:hypothetical protein
MQAQNGADILPYVRLVVPNVDSERTYGLKEKTMAALVTSVSWLCMSRHMFVFAA